MPAAELTATAMETETDGKVRVANGMNHRHTGQADCVGGNRHQERKGTADDARRSTGQ
jgi:hypothetical protein